MSMLNQLMSNIQGNVMSRAASKRSGKDDLGKENRAAYRKLMESAIKEGNQEQIAALAKSAPAGVDPSIYTTVAGMRTPEQEAKDLFDNTLAQFMTNFLGGGQTQPQPQPQGKAVSLQGPAKATISGATSLTPAATPAPPEPTTKSADIFTPDFLLRAALKKFAGIDVGGHYFESPQWFDAYGDRVKNGVPVSQALSDTAIEFGFIPSGASNLEGLSKEDRQIIFERDLQTALDDPTLDSVVRKLVPKGTDIQKSKLGLILGTFAEHGQYIPDHYQPFLDRFRGLEDPDFISDELKTHIYQTTGKMPHETDPSDVAKAQKEMGDDALVQTMREAYYRIKGKTKAEWEMEIGKPISAEDRAEHGIGSKIKTYQQLADERKRFATEADRKMYQELYTARERLIKMEELLFGSKEHPEHGIFIGIDKSVTARSAAKARLLWEKANGTQRGRNLEEYNDYMAYFARTLIKIAGESGSRLSDQDIQGIISVMSDTGRGLTGVPDSEALARSKYEHAVADMARLMKLLEDTTTVVPSGQPGFESDKGAQKLIDKYTKEKRQ